MTIIMQTGSTIVVITVQKKDICGGLICKYTRRGYLTAPLPLRGLRSYKYILKFSDYPCLNV